MSRKQKWFLLLIVLVLMLLLPTAALASQTDEVENISTGVTFIDLDSAINAARDGETLRLLSDVSVRRKQYLDKSITLDLAGHAITGNNSTPNTPVFHVTGSGINFTLKSGTFTSAGNSAIWVKNGAHVEIVDASVSADNMSVLDAYAGSSITLRGNTHIQMTGNISSYGTVYLDGGNLSIEDDSVVVGGGTAASFCIVGPASP